VVPKLVPSKQLATEVNVPTCQDAVKNIRSDKCEKLNQPKDIGAKSDNGRV
jgi:hypothetical protein